MNGSQLNQTNDISINSINVFDLFLFLTISLVATFGNIVVFICYYKFHSLRTVTNVFMLSLSASDLLVALFSIPLTICVFVFNVYHKNMYYVGDMMPSIVSIYSLALVAVDRAMVITKPYFHQEKITRKSAWVSVCITWLLMLSYTLAGMAFNDPNGYYAKKFTITVVFVSYGFPVAVMIISYTIMGFVAKKHAKELKSLDRTIVRLRSDRDVLITEDSPSLIKNKIIDELKTENKIQDIKNSTSLQSSGNGHVISGLSSTRHLKRELKAALTLSMILSCFIITWTPFMSLNMIHLANKKFNQVLVKYFKILHYANSALNPILYVILNQRWRKAFTKILCNCNNQNPFRTKSSLNKSSPSFSKRSNDW
ncbi:dopamine D2-like receptor [Hydra vulgaris]|uniref:Dopamine D2-like receptor n=1 Tax=Hydra vulgaris TaxID=6087 RepID=A0ABM4BR83_HYDVU